MEVETVELVPGQSVDGVENEGRRVVVSGNVHVEASVGELGRIDDGDGCVGGVDAAIGGVLVEELGEGVEGS